MSFSSFFSSWTLLKGWRRYGVAFALGLLGALAFPPFNAIPVLWVAFPGLALLLHEPLTKRQGFFTGWSFAFGFLLICYYWIAGALFVDLKSFWWVLPLAVGGLPALTAIYYGFATLLVSRWGVGRWHGILFLGLCWFLADSARAHLLTGFPWDILGYVWGDCLPVLQITSVIGIEGLSLLTALLAVLPALFFVWPWRRATAVLGSGLLVLIVIAGWGAHRLAEIETKTEDAIYLRLVQPQTDQKMKWADAYRQSNLEALLDLSFTTPSEHPIKYYLWPETATAYYLAERPDIRSKIAARMPKGTFLLTGTVRRQIGDDDEIHYYNSLVVMDSSGRIIAGYDKHHLVPFGEYIPFRRYLPSFLRTVTGADFTAGEGVRSLRAPGLPPFSALVCYEAIFSGEVVEKEDPPEFLVNVTNDAWYKGTIGPIQHFLIARIRAIEEGLPLYRVANMGFTASIDPLGRPFSLRGPGQKEVVDSPLIQPISGNTFKEKQGNLASWLIFAAVLTLLMLALLKEKSHKRP